VFDSSGLVWSRSCHANASGQRVMTISSRKRTTHEARVPVLLADVVRAMGGGQRLVKQADVRFGV